MSMAKNIKKTTNKRAVKSETDSTYLFKLVMYMIIGSQWLHIVRGGSDIPLPVGFVIGLLFTAHEHFQIDRKIEYAVLLMSMFLGFWLPMGITWVR